jgi:acetyl esterase/lipase
MGLPLRNEEGNSRSECDSEQAAGIRPFINGCGCDPGVFLRCVLLLCLLALCGCQAGLFGAVNLSREGGEWLAEEGIDFHPTLDLKLDVYRPAATRADAPIVLFYYGGSWRNGQRGWYRFVGNSFARLGAITVIADYRTYPEAPFPLFMDDAAAAVAWVDGNRERLGSSGPLLLAGHSAGAHIAALLATDPSHLRRRGLDPAQIDGVIGLAGPYDFLPIESRKVRQVFVDDAGAQAAQPVRHVSTAAPPFLLVHGLDDDLVWPQNSRSMTAALRAAGRPVELVLLPEMGHIELVFAIGQDDPAGLQLERLFANFLRQLSE